MPYVPPQRYKPQPPKRRSRRSWWVIPLVVLGLSGGINYARPLPAVQTSFTYQLPRVSTATELDWPQQGQAALAAEGYGMLASYGEQKAIATASTTKVLLALCVMDALPITAGSQGKTFTITQADVDLYTYYVANVGSRVPVELGQQMSEYQAIEALMLPSANNIADSLVTWVFGGQAQYATYAAQYLQKHHILETHVGTDASGYDPSTVSTATDLSKIGLLALQNDTLMAIAGQTDAPFPIAGTVSNYNTVLGKNGITGLKTGNNDANPGAFLFTATAHYAGRDVRIAGAVLDASDLQSALDASVALVGSAEQHFEPLTVATKGVQVAQAKTAWGEQVPVLVASDVRLIRWKATGLNERHRLDPNVKSGEIGRLQVRAGEIESTANLVLANPIPAPSFWWRLTRL